MTDKEKTIRELKEALDGLDITNKYRLNIIRAIEYLQEEPVSMWHDASKEPKPNMELICVGQYGNPLVLSSNSDSFKERYISKWAYFNDLLNLSNAQRTTKDCKEPVSEDLEEASKEWLSPQLDKSYAAYGETKQMELTHFDGYAMLDAIEFGAQWQQAKDESTTEDLGDYINELSKQFPDVSFAKLSRIAVRVSRWQRNQDVKNKLPKVINRTDLDEYAYQCAYDMSNDWMIENPTWKDVEDACKLGAKWQKQQDQSTIELAEDHAMLAGM